MDSRMYASSAVTVEPSASSTLAPYKPLREGARPLPLARWQVLQAFSAKSFSPATTGFSVASEEPESQAAYSIGSITVTHPPMSAWLVPQYCWQKKWKRAALVGRNHMV